MSILRLRTTTIASPKVKEASIVAPKIKSVSVKLPKILSALRGGILIKNIQVTVGSVPRIKSAKIHQPLFKTVQLTSAPAIIKAQKINQPLLKSTSFVRIKIRKTQTQQVVLDAFKILDSPSFKFVKPYGNQRTYYRDAFETISIAVSISVFEPQMRLGEVMGLTSVFARDISTVKLSNVSLSSDVPLFTRGITLAQQSVSIASFIPTKNILRAPLTSVTVRIANPLFSFLINPTNLVSTQTFIQLIRIFNENPLSTVAQSDIIFKGKNFKTPILASDIVNKLIIKAPVIENIYTKNDILNKKFNKNLIESVRATSKQITGRNFKTPVLASDIVNKFITKAPVIENIYTKNDILNKKFNKNLIESVRATSKQIIGRNFKTPVLAADSIKKYVTKAPVIENIYTKNDILNKKFNKNLIESVKATSKQIIGRNFKTPVLTADSIKKYVTKPIAESVTLNDTDSEHNKNFKDFFKNHLTHGINITPTPIVGRNFKTPVLTADSIKKYVTKPIAESVTLNDTDSEHNKNFKDFFKNHLTHGINITPTPIVGKNFKTFSTVKSIITKQPYINIYESYTGSVRGLKVSINASPINSSQSLIRKYVTKPILSKVDFTHRLFPGLFIKSLVLTITPYLRKKTFKNIYESYSGSEIGTKTNIASTEIKFVTKPIPSSIRVTSKIAHYGPYKRSLITMFSVKERKYVTKVISVAANTDSKINKKFERPVFSNITTRAVPVVAPYRKTEARAKSILNKYVKLFFDRSAINERQELGISFNHLIAFTYIRPLITSLNTKSLINIGRLLHDNTTASVTTERFLRKKDTTSSAVKMSVSIAMGQQYTIPPSSVQLKTANVFTGFFAKNNIALTKSIRKDLVRAAISTGLLITEIKPFILPKTEKASALQVKTKIIPGRVYHSIIKATSLNLEKFIKLGNTFSATTAISSSSKLFNKPNISKLNIISSTLPSYSILPVNRLNINSNYLLIFKRKHLNPLSVSAVSNTDNTPLKNIFENLILSSKVVKGNVKVSTLLANINVKKLSYKALNSSLTIKNDINNTTVFKPFNNNIIVASKILKGSISKSNLDMSVIEEKDTILNKDSKIKFSVNILDKFYRKSLQNNLQVDSLVLRGPTKLNKVQSASRNIALFKLRKESAVRLKGLLDRTDVIKAVADTISTISRISIDPYVKAFIQAKISENKDFIIGGTINRAIVNSNTLVIPSINIQDATAVADSGVLYNQSYSQEYFLEGYVGDERVLT